MAPKYSGGCKCGNITYTVDGEAQWRVSCHCNWCQTTSGSAFRTFVLFNESDLAISGDTLRSYEDNNTDHGRPMINQFCSRCGTQLGIKVPSMDARHIALGTLDQRKEIEIKDNIWWQEALNFVSFPNIGLPALRQCKGNPLNLVILFISLMLSGCICNFHFISVIECTQL